MATVPIEYCQREDCIRPSDGDMVVTWVLPGDQGQMRLRLCQRHLERLLRQLATGMMDR